MQTQKIKVVDTVGAPAYAEIGHCGRDNCRHVHIEPDRFDKLLDWTKSNAEGIGLTVGDGREKTRRPSFAAKDAQEALFFLVSQLAYTEAGLFARSYQPLQYKDLIPQDYSAGEAADVIRYEIYDEVGQADDVNPKSDDIPTVDVLYADKTYPVSHAGIGYDFTTQELRATAFLRRPLPERKLHAAMQAYDQFLNVVGLSGRVKKNYTGLLNNTTITHAVTPSGKAWSAASGITAAEIVSDFNFGLNAVWVGSKFTVIPDTVGIPSFAWQYINAVPATGTTGSFQVSVLKYLMENNLSVAKNVPLNIVPIYRANTVGNGGTGPGASAASRAVFYRKTDQDLIQHVPLPLRFLAPQLVGLKVKVPGEFRYAGVEVRRPPSFYYMDGV
jgi:hypothetical protein